MEVTAAFILEADIEVTGIRSNRYSDLIACITGILGKLYRTVVNILLNGNGMQYLLIIDG